MENASKRFGTCYAAIPYIGHRSIDNLFASLVERQFVLNTNIRIRKDDSGLTGKPFKLAAADSTDP